MVTVSPASSAPSAAEVLYARYAGRLPASLEKLTGPDHGVVHLPLHVAWSGLRAYDLDRPRLRMGMYRTVLAEGQHEDLVHLLNRDLLITQWPVLRTLVPRHLRQAWEEAFPELTAEESPAA
ncbi:hypothetical protein [Streptomyces antarcticus]|uniref:hypothetical protein n=1 Tax=Streptomyces antarcticus TaxID=2996458 RepID=UPI00226D4BCD|nr:MULTISPECIES: hypothetical protein [unclassified Streptomyces]MCY0944826.1 hypothetical protein [Streptomyces sp. H34-AA3]MCY0953206.1 hypothetical protein [Streptomyces sp. H27-S2]MCZ4081141.1 hypothetical protein [Streptomyces sp. H34-S5]